MEQIVLNELPQDADMPLDELLKLYRKNTPTINNNRLQDEEVK